MIKILLAGDDELFTDALQMIIEKGMDAAVEAIVTSGLEEKIAGSYHMVLLDVDVAGLPAAGIVQKILNQNKNVRILIFSEKPDSPFAKMYLQSGAKGYLVKSAAADEILNAVNTILAGNRYVSKRLEEELVSDALTGRSANPFDNLSSREMEILKAMLEGKSVGEISGMLGLHSSTISTFKSRIYDKMKTRNISEIAALAKAYGAF